MANNTKPILTISLLASNRPDTIRKCLDSLRPIMEAIPSELILVDTSKSEEIRKILLEYTDQVYEFEWCRDFAKARNVGLKAAKGEWFLFLDDDEWFVEVEALIEFFTSGEYKNYGYANYLVRNFMDVDYINYSDGWVSRMIRIDDDTEFVGKIHEAFGPIRGAQKDIEAMVYHSGYIFATEEERRAHFERNTTLLLEAIDKEPENMRWRMQLMQEYHSVQEWEKLMECCEAAFAQLEGKDGIIQNVERCSFYAGYTLALMKTEQLQGCIDTCEKLLEKKNILDTLAAFLHLRMARCYFELKNWQEAGMHAKKYMAGYVRRNTVPYLGEMFGESNLKSAYCVLISCDLRQGSSKALEEYYDCLEWNQARAYSDADIEQALIEAMGTQPFQPLFIKVVTDVYRNRGLRSYMNLALKSVEEESEQFRNIMAIYARAEADEGTIWYARACVADWNEDREAVAAAIKDFFRTAENVFRIPSKLCEIAKKYEVDIYQYWREVPPTMWKEHVRDYFEWASEENCKLTIDRVMQVFEPLEWRCIYFMIGEMAREVRRGIGDISQLNNYHKILDSFSSMTILYYQRYYRQELFTTYTELLPLQVQVAIKIAEYVRLEEQNLEQAIANLEECAQLYPDFAKPLRRYIKWPEELRRQRVAARRDARREQRRNLIEQVEQLIKDGKGQEALEEVSKLKELYPKDLEIIALCLEARLASLEE